MKHRTQWHGTQLHFGSRTVFARGFGYAFLLKVGVFATASLIAIWVVASILSAIVSMITALYRAIADGLHVIVNGGAAVADFAWRYWYVCLAALVLGLVLDSWPSPER
jgi:hypothetical protein